MPDNFGLLKISEPRNVAVNVIFVHGLTGDPYETWTNDKGEFWPEWLSEDIDGLRVFSLGYPASLIEKWAKSELDIGEQATLTLAEMEVLEIGEKPIAFIAHSLGGILVKQILRTATDSNNPRYNAISKNTKLITFLSTPHAGSVLASRLKFAFPRLASRHIKLLSKDGGRLHGLNNHFRAFCKRNPILDVLVFYETHKTWALAKVVTRESADMGIATHEPIPVPADHIQISKPTKKSDTVYQQIHFYLKKLINQSEFDAPNRSIENPEINLFANNCYVTIVPETFDLRPPTAKIFFTLSIWSKNDSIYLKELNVSRTSNGEDWTLRKIRGWKKIAGSKSVIKHLDPDFETYIGDNNSLLAKVPKDEAIEFKLDCLFYPPSDAVQYKHSGGLDEGTITNLDASMIIEMKIGFGHDLSDTYLISTEHDADRGNLKITSESWKSTETADQLRPTSTGPMVERYDKKSEINLDLNSTAPDSFSGWLIKKFWNTILRYPVLLVLGLSAVISVVGFDNTVEILKSIFNKPIVESKLEDTRTVISPAKSQTIPPHKLLPEMVKIDSGIFTMGSSDLNSSEARPQIEIQIDAPFYISKHEITWSQWEQCFHASQCKQKTSSKEEYISPNQPIVQVSWSEASMYAKYLSSITGQLYRLPTEAEWEYAARANNDNETTFEINQICKYENVFDESGLGLRANTAGSIGCEDKYPFTAPVGEFLPNDFGLYDMFGNVGEWVADCYVANLSNTPQNGTAFKQADCPRKVVKGGSHSTHRLSAFRPSQRRGLNINDKDWSVGFRVVRED